MPPSTALPDLDPTDPASLGRFVEHALAMAPGCRNVLDPTALNKPRLDAHGELLSSIGRRAALDAPALAGCPGVLSQPPYPGIAAIASLLQQRLAWSREQLVLDGLAGDGRVGAALQTLHPEAPRQIGCDVCLGLAAAGLRQGRPVLWSDLRGALVRERVADHALASHGLYRLPRGERGSFVRALARRLRGGGSLVLLDFEQGSPSARWHTECVAVYRRSGHPFEHYTRDGLVALLDQAGLIDVELHLIYDPVVLRAAPDEDDAEVHARFVRQLRATFALDLGQPDDARASALSNRVAPYFRIELPQQFANHPLAAEQLGLRDIDGRRALIAPRLAIAAIGTRPG